MKYIELEKPLVDGRVFNFHKPTEIKVISGPEPFVIEVKLGSWHSREAMLMGASPDGFTKITLVKPTATITETFLNTIMEQIVALPEWQSATIVDLSIPQPLPVDEDDF